MKSSRILIEIPTKDRDPILGKFIAALLLQSYQEFDVLILNDGDREVGTSSLTSWLLPFLRIGREVWIEEGSRISQAHNHNVPLYDPRFKDYKYYVRSDDDVLMDRHALLRLYGAIRGTEAGAVGGLWMEREDLGNIHDRKIFATVEEFNADPSINGNADIMNSNWQQRVYHPTDDLMPVEHIYSVAIVDMEKMRRAGGWPEVYSHGVAHGEETDGTYRLHLSGEKLFICPMVTGQHLRSPGGIRSQSNLGQIQQMDLMKWQRRLPELRKIEFSPTIAVECRHSYGLGGAERLFYDTVHLLQSEFGQDRVHPIFPCPHMSPEEVEDAFGFTYFAPPQELPEYDVLIVLGHEPEHTTEAKKKIFYCLFPIQGMEQKALEGFDHIVGISDYTCEHIRDLLRYKCSRIYPPVASIGFLQEDKEDIILVVSRCVPFKAPLWLMKQFINMNLTGWKLEVVLATSVEAFDDYEKETLDFAAAHGDIVVHRNVTNAELHGLYRKAKIFWGASGMRGSPPQAAEHFGYTPVEAWSAGCIPVMYDRGGHQETVAEQFRWLDQDDLSTITVDLMHGEWENWQIADAVDLDLFSPGSFVRQWSDLIRRVNALAIGLERIESIRIENKRIRVAMVSDSPYFEELGVGVTSGFGNVAGQIARRFVEEPDIDLSVFGLYDPRMPKRSDNLPFDFFPPIADAGGTRSIPAYLQWAKPDVIFMLHAPGELLGWVQQFRALPGLTQPIVAYFPIEGAYRPNSAVVPLMDRLAFPVTYCKSGADLIKQFLPSKEIPYVYHGIDHADFKALNPSDREHIREVVGFKDKFVIMAMGTNKRVKQHPVLIEAMKIILSLGYEDIYLYIHAKEYDDHVLQGHHLRNILKIDEHITGLPLQKHILFPVIEDKWHASAYTDPVLQMWKHVKPPDAKMRGFFFNALDIISRYGISDLCVDISSAEGFGLVSLEAVACGVPAISVHDRMVRDEVHSKYMIDMIEPAYWDTWHTGTRLAMVAPDDVAEAILRAYKHPKGKTFNAEMAEKVKADLKWSDATDLFVKLVREADALPKKA